MMFKKKKKLSSTVSGYEGEDIRSNNFMIVALDRLAQKLDIVVSYGVTHWVAPKHVFTQCCNSVFCIASGLH